MLSHNGKQKQPLSLLRSHMNVGVRGQRKVGEHVEAHTKSQSFSLLQSEQMLTHEVNNEMTALLIDGRYNLQSEWHNIPPTFCTTCRWKGSTFWDTDIQWWYFTHQLFWSCSGSAVLGVWKNTSSSTPEESQSCSPPPSFSSLNWVCSACCLEYIPPQDPPPGWIKCFSRCLSQATYFMVSSLWL